MDVLSAADVSDKSPGGPRTSLKGQHSERNAVAFHVKYSVVPQWFDGSHPAAIGRGLAVVRPDWKELSADAVKKLLPAATTGS